MAGHNRLRSPNEHKDPLLKSLAKAFQDMQPNRWLTGTLPVPPEDLTLFFKITGSQSESRVISPPFDDVESIEALALACERATFGRDNKDASNETYPEASKLDPGRFSWGFHPSVLERQIRDSLVPFEGTTHRLRFERHKLNVYGKYKLYLAPECTTQITIRKGKDSFSKPHKDTPRGEDMVGSLVLILPVKHEGGALVLRHAGDEFTFDASASLRSSEESSLAYAAFYGDVEHEVLPVTSGHRITITYNIFADKNYDYAFTKQDHRVRERMKPSTKWHGWNGDERDSDPPSPPPLKRYDILGTGFTSPFVDTFSKLLDNPRFLSFGGYLGFCLQHLYPVPQIPGQEDTVDWEDLMSRLKGRDAILAHTCAEIGLKHYLRAVYTDSPDNIRNGTWVVTSKGLHEIGSDNDIPDELENMDEDVVLTWQAGKEFRADRSDETTTPVQWITSPFSLTEVCEPSSTQDYENEAGGTYIYTNFALIVRVGEFGNRTRQED